MICVGAKEMNLPDHFIDIILAEDGSNPLDSGRGSIQILYAPGR